MFQVEVQWTWADNTTGSRHTVLCHWQAPTKKGKVVPLWQLKMGTQGLAETKLTE